MAGTDAHAVPKGRRRGIGWLLVVMSLVSLLVAGGCGKEVDPVEQIRALVPEIAAALNQRDIGGLRRLGTSNLEANRLIIDVFAEGGDGTVTLGFKRVRMLEGRAELTVELRNQTDGTASRELVFELEGNGRWRIDSYTFLEALPDTSGAPAADSV